MTLSHRSEQAAPIVVKARWGGLLDRADLCEYLKCSRPTLDKEIARGTIPPPIRWGGRDKWRKDDIDRALANLTGGGTLPDYERRFLEGRAA